MVLPRHLLKNGGHARGVFQRRKNTQIPPISLALRPQTIRHPDKCSKLENDATCRLNQLWHGPSCPDSNGHEMGGQAKPSQERADVTLRKWPNPTVEPMLAGRRSLVVR